jgi:FkbM family methyltransferase
VLRHAASALIEQLPQWLSVRIKAHHYARFLRPESICSDPDLSAIRLLVRAGDNVLDVGANVGVWTHYLSAQVGASGRVWSFEPIQQTFALLRRNIGRFGLGNVVAIDRAISDKEMTVSMSVPKDSRGIRNYHLAQIVPAGSSNSVKVVSMRLDSWFLEVGEPHVAFVKIDAEGHELACIRGMSLLLARLLPSLCVEISSDLDDPSSDGASIERGLKVYGYETYLWTGVSFRTRCKGERSINYFFLRSEHLLFANGATGA